MSKPLVFKFNGQAKFNSNYSENRSFGRKLVETLNHDSESVALEISKAFSEQIGGDYDIADIHIRFRHSSIIWEGAVTILGLGADIAGNIALIIYLRSAIERAINAVIGHRLRDCIDWMGTSVSLPSGTLTEMSDNNTVSASFFKIPIATVLKWVTILNAALFLGGTVFTGVTIHSAVDRYQEAQRRLSEAETLYLTKQRELESIASDFALSIRKFEDQANSYTNKIQNLDTDMESLTTQVQSHRSELQKIQTQIENLKKASTPTGFYEIWTYTTLNVKILIFTVIIMILIQSVVLSIIILKRKPDRGIFTL
jgi:hypothetical protein